MNKKRVAVIFGGKSPEHEVSIITGIQVIENIDKNAFDVFPVYISKDGRWFSGSEFSQIETYSKLLQFSKNDQRTISLDNEEKALLPVEKKGLFKKQTSEEIDVIFPTFHGGLGEMVGHQDFLK